LAYEHNKIILVRKVLIVFIILTICYMSSLQYRTSLFGPQFTLVIHKLSTSPQLWSACFSLLQNIKHLASSQSLDP